MKMNLVVLAALSLGACSKQPEVSQAPLATPPPPPAPVVIATPAPPPEKHLAAPGVFYLVQSVKVENSDGIISLPAGTGVKLVRPGTYLTPVGEWQLTDSQITNDLDLARAVRDADVNNKAALAKFRASEEAKAEAARAVREKKDMALHAEQLDGVDRETLTRKLAALRDRKAALQTQLSALSVASSREYYGRVFQHRIEANSSGDAMGGVRADINKVDAQILEAEKALARLPAH